MSDYMQAKIQITADKVTRAGSAGYIVARTARPENPGALQGFYADNILFIIDEAAGVPEKVFEVARGALARGLGAHPQIRFKRLPKVEVGAE